MDNLNLRKLEYFPDKNPFLDKSKIHIQNETITAHVGHHKLINFKTDKILTLPMICTIEEKNKRQFVEVFADDVQKIFNLSRTGRRVFIEILLLYQSDQLIDNFTDSIILVWLDDGLNGMKLDMGNKTFQNGLKELISKEFLKPKLRNQYWVNPAIFFKGDKIAFIKEYQIKPSFTKTEEKTNQVKQDLPDDGYQTDIEDFTNK
ncbi:hypothetical protein [Bartonella schoenbuchensis]|uniref:Plasmid replication protein RepL domain-containing protein n=1 Tax=Bartonella schoenbuchensis (strain DSM 13525 / NCTC 13165 / R1) TaxID=687861 RepID=E6Z0P6_BARSR|nr:hypothetical protein [Bartonella schoenbuchensis]AQX31578.1 hypothetical protein BscR1v2_016750 [Bartonella schoenbuchensis R1]CBI82684.1 conserved hypothetical protein [Bartonella schoenbuchensis R1]